MTTTRPGGRTEQGRPGRIEMGNRGRHFVTAAAIAISNPAGNDEATAPSYTDHQTPPTVGAGGRLALGGVGFFGISRPRRHRRVPA
jgi:hypothetical protein